MACIGSEDWAVERIVEFLARLIEICFVTYVGSHSPGGIRIPILYTIIQKSVTQICIIEWLLLSLQTKYKRA